MDIGPLPVEYPKPKPTSELPEVPELGVKSCEVAIMLYKLYPKGDESIYKKFALTGLGRSETRAFREHLSKNGIKYSSKVMKKLREIENSICK